jgi:hypothetical protein
VFVAEVVAVGGCAAALADGLGHWGYSSGTSRGLPVRASPTCSMASSLMTCATNRSGDWVRQWRPRTPNQPRTIVSSRPMDRATSAEVSSWARMYSSSQSRNGPIESTRVEPWLPPAVGAGKRSVVPGTVCCVMVITLSTPGGRGRSRRTGRCCASSSTGAPGTWCPRTWLRTGRRHRPLPQLGSVVSHGPVDAPLCVRCGHPGVCSHPVS